MSSFRAVSTTGIYCQPGCPARPRPENVSSYGTAAAAEAAGYRACLRCRPYRSSETTGWVDGPELVCRAVRRILDGALDGPTEDDLSASLGVSARHLRRLFAEHVGATPDQVARSRRSHFARRLLDETDLSVTDVAFASGFGSVRQMSRAMQDVFGESPTRLRERRRSKDRLVADGGLVCRIPFAAPLDWSRVMGFLGPRSIPGVESVIDGIYRRTIDIEGATGVVEVSPGGEDHLLATFHLPHWEDLIHHVSRLRRLFDLDHDPARTEAAFADDPVLSPWPSGLRVTGCWDPWEAGVRAILGQQVSVARATATAGRIAAENGSPVDGLESFALERSFPSPELILKADLPVPRQRANAIRAFTEAHLAGELPLDGSVDLETFEERMCELPGIGPWTAQYLALRLGYADAFPATDLHIARRLTESGHDTSGDHWSPWRAYATLRLWELKP